MRELLLQCCPKPVDDGSAAVWAPLAGTPNHPEGFQQQHPQICPQLLQCWWGLPHCAIIQLQDADASEVHRCAWLHPLPHTCKPSPNCHSNRAQHEEVGQGLKLVVVWARLLLLHPQHLLLWLLLCWSTRSLFPNPPMSVLLLLLLLLV
jgi:hypothetical protein